MSNFTLLPVLESFNSIQGEGTMMGQPASFIRLAGCNLKCPWCDTKESWKTHLSKDVKLMSADEIVAVLDLLPNVIITGGEPCIHDGLQQLVNRLKKTGRYVCLETNATLPTPENVDWVVASPKPGSYKIHPDCLFNELKYVVSPELNFEEHVLPVMKDNDCVPVWLQPNGEDMQASAKKAFDIVMRYPNSSLKLGLQMHKIFDFR